MTHVYIGVLTIHQIIPRVHQEYIIVQTVSTGIIQLIIVFLILDMVEAVLVDQEAAVIMVAHQEAVLITVAYTNTGMTI